MNKKLIIFTAVSLIWCFVLAFYVIVQNRSFYTLLQADNLVAEVWLTKIPIEKKPVTILAFGDMMLDRAVRAQINKNGPEYPFALIKDFLKGEGGNANDILVANAEGPFTYNQSVTVGRKNAPLVFTFDPAVLPTLKNLGFTLFGQANNHTLNFGMAGYRQSTSSIEAAGLDWFGDPRNKDVTAFVKEIRGEKIAFIGYHEFAYFGLPNVLRAIEEAKANSTFVVVYPHWGEEYKLNNNLSQQKTAHAFVDAGADVVIGAHPHVIQPIEIYKNKLIFYSLGNFIFDQSATDNTGRGLAIKISLDPNLATYNLFPISIVKQQAALMDEEERQKELNRLGFQNGAIIVTR